MVFEEIFRYADKNSDNFLTLDEIILLASPDINNDNNISENERQIGLRTAKEWIAYMIHFDRNNENKILNDKKISLNELKLCSSYETPNLWKDGYTNGFKTLNEYGTELYSEVEQLLSA